MRAWVVAALCLLIVAGSGCGIGDRIRGTGTVIIENCSDQTIHRISVFRSATDFDLYPNVHLNPGDEEFLTLDEGFYDITVHWAGALHRIFYSVHVRAGHPRELEACY